MPSKYEDFNPIGIHLVPVSSGEVYQLRIIEAEGAETHSWYMGTFALDANLHETLNGFPGHKEDE